MNPQRYEIKSWNEWDGVSLSPAEDGDLLLYADADKWVGKEVAIIQNEKELAEEHLRLDTITWEKALKKRDKEIAALKTFIKEKLHLKYPHGANGCCCLFDDDENQIQWCSVHKALRDDVAALTEELESHAWKISPAMVQAKIDEMSGEIAALKILIDGAIGIVTAFPVNLPAQKDWLAKAREALK